MSIRLSRGRKSCYYCRCSFNWDDPRSQYYPTKDHKHPRSRGGKGGTNIVLACRRCNEEKGSMTVAEYREFLEVTKGLRGEHREADQVGQPHRAAAQR